MLWLTIHQGVHEQLVIDLGWKSQDSQSNNLISIFECWLITPNMSYFYFRVIARGKTVRPKIVLGCLTDFLPNWQRRLDGRRLALGLYFDGKFWDSISSEKLACMKYANL